MFKFIEEKIIKKLFLYKLVKNGFSFVLPYSEKKPENLSLGMDKEIVVGTIVGLITGLLVAGTLFGLHPLIGIFIGLPTGYYAGLIGFFIGYYFCDWILLLTLIVVVASLTL